MVYMFLYMFFKAGEVDSNEFTNCNGIVQFFVWGVDMVWLSSLVVWVNLG